MLDHDIDMPDGWQNAWLERTLPELRYYNLFAGYFLALTIFGIGKYRQHNGLYLKPTTA